MIDSMTGTLTEEVPISEALALVDMLLMFSLHLYDYRASFVLLRRLHTVHSLLDYRKKKDTNCGFRPQMFPSQTDMQLDASQKELIVLTIGRPTLRMHTTKTS